MFKRVMMLLLMGLIVVSCSSRKSKNSMSAKERLRYAMEKYNDEDYLDAKTEFRIIVLNFPGQSVVDTAQFHLGECHFKMKEYILASAEYEKLTRMFPASNYVDDAQYKIGYSNFMLSPKYALDQSSTIKAIEELQKFADDFPKSDLVDEANDLMLKCREKLAKKEYKTGELYRKMADYDAAVLYFDSVLNIYYDTKFAKDAQFWLAECSRRGEQYERAIQEFERYLNRYSDDSRIEDVKKLIQQSRHSKILQEKQPKPEDDVNELSF